MQLSLRLHIQFPNQLASYNPPPKNNLDPLPLATAAQWTPQPGMNGSRGAFAVAVGHAHKAKANAHLFAVTTPQSYTEVRDGYYYIAGQWDGFHYEWNGVVYADSPSLHPLKPVLGVKGNQTGFGGDSGGAFAEYLWKEDKAGHSLNSYVGEAKFARDQMAYAAPYGTHNDQLESFFVDMSQQNAIVSLFSGGLANWVTPHGDIVLPKYAATGIPLIILVPPATVMSPAVQSFIDKVNGYLPNVTWAANYAPGSSVRDQFAAAVGGKFVDYFRVTMNGTFVHVDGTGSQPCMVPATFTNQVLNNPAYAGRHVMFECGGDSLLVLNQLT